MFIVNDRGNICEEARSITMGVRLDETIIKKIEAKKEEIVKIESERALYFGGMHIPLDIINYQLEEYARQFDDEIELAVIYVNDTEFGAYKRKIGETIFRNIIDALKRQEILFDLRDFDKIGI